MNNASGAIESARHFAPFVQTTSIDDNALAYQKREWTQRWSDVVNNRLDALQHRIGEVIDGMTYPSHVAIRAARLAAFRLAQQMDAPQRIVPNGVGGIVFEFDRGDQLTEVEFCDDGAIEIRSFDGLTLSWETSFRSEDNAV
jgi:hypothetical protein